MAPNPITKAVNYCCALMIGKQGHGWSRRQPSGSVQNGEPRWRWPLSIRHDRSTSALASRGIASRKAAETAEVAVRTSNSELKAARAEVELAAAQQRQAEIILEKMVIRAPFDGRLSLINVRVGDYVEGVARGSHTSRETSAAAILVNEETFEITLNVPWPDAKELTPGQHVFAGSNAEALWEAATTDKSHPDVAIGQI